jgi:hypothetical protein
MFVTIEHKFTLNKPPLDFASNLPFTTRLDAAAYTGSPNGTTTPNGVGSWVGGQTYPADPYSNINAQAPDLTYPNSAYWARMDAFVSLCASKGLAIFMFPAYLGYGGADEGWMSEMVANDAAIGAGGLAAQSWSNSAKSRLWNYSAWLAQHYASYSNIVWVLGGDFGTGVSGPLTTAQSNAVNSVLSGMKSISGQRSTLWTSHWGRDSLGTDLTQFAASLDLESIYEGAAAATEARSGYAHTPTKPAFVLEDYYEGNPNAGGTVRRFHWWSLFGTTAGQFFGNDALWPVATGWQSQLNSQGSQDMTKLIAFVRSIAWQNLVPSGLGSQKTIAVVNGSTSSQADYVACAASAVVAGCYVPPGWAHGTLGIDATVLPSAFRARWLNPFTGAYTLISGSVPNTGTATFTPPGDNGSGLTDWVLVLDVTG